MYDEAKKICEEKRKPFKFGIEMVNFGNLYHEESIFDMFPFFAEALEELKSSESLPTFQQLRKTLSLLEFVITTGNCFKFASGVRRAKQACLHECVPDESDDQDVKKGPEDMIKILNQLWINLLE